VSVERERFVRTVLGDVPAADLGLTLAHEHLLIDLRNQFVPPSDPERLRLSREPVGPATVELLARNPYALADNLVLDDVELCARELGRFAALGGRTVVDGTSGGLGRDPGKLRRLATLTGLNIVAGSGYYTHDTHPADMATRSAEQIATEIVRDLTVGIGGTDVRAGVIGEVGTSQQIHPDEHKNLLAAAMAHASVPAAIHVHTFPWTREGTKAADTLIERGVDPAKVVIDHLDVDIDPEYIGQLLVRGVIVEFDCFGKEYQLSARDESFAPGRFATDAERIEALKRLLDEGYERQLLITNDLSFKSLLVEHGGRGYAHVMADIVPALRDAGVDHATMDTLLIANPARLLAL
jgi:phosphotriesterase-related protein